MDKLDFRLLAELMRDSRQPLTALAKKLRTSREVLDYRINKLVEDKVILGFITEIDVEKFGFVGAAVFVNVKLTKQEGFRNFLKSCPFVSWVAEFAGVWSFIFSIYGKTNEELDEKFSQIYKKFKDSIIDHRFALHRKNTFFYEKYFGAQGMVGVTSQRLRAIEKKIKEVEYKIDNKDKIILRELAKNSWIDSVTLGKKSGLTAPAAAKRVRQLKEAGYILRYSIFVDETKLGLYHYSIFIQNKNLNELPKLLAYLSQHPKVSYIAEYVADPYLEFGLFVASPYDLKKLLEEIEEVFPSNRITEISLYQKEFVSVGPPDCVFE